MLKISDVNWSFILKSRVRFEQTRCRVACVEESFVLEFLFLFGQAKRKEEKSMWFETLFPKVPINQM